MKCFAGFRGVIGLALVAVVATACPPTGGGGTTESYTLLYPASQYLQGPDEVSQRSMSADGRFVVWREYDEATTTNSVKVFDRVTGSTTVVPTYAGFKGPYNLPIISADGSTVFFTGSTPTPAPPPIGNYDALWRYRTATGAVDHFDLPIDPTYGYSASSEILTASGDGSTVAFSAAWATGHLIWKESTGFLPGPARAFGTEFIPTTALSTNGRYLMTTGFVSLPDPDGFENGVPEKISIIVHDLQTNTIRTQWESGVRNVYRPVFGPDPWDLRFGATLDDGSVIFSYNSNAGVFLLDAATGTIAQTAGYESVVVQAGSRNGRFVSYTGPNSIVPNLGNVNELADRTTAGVTRMSGYGDPGRTRAKAISDDGRYVLLYSTEPGRVPNGPGVYLWDRGA